MEISGIGRVIFWGGGSLWIGQAFAPIRLHSHHALQLCIGFDGPVQLRARPGANWDFFACAMIAPDIEHEFCAPGRLVANILLEPESIVGRSLMQRYGNSAIVAIAEGAASETIGNIRTAWASGADDDVLADVTGVSLNLLAGTEPLRKDGDFRIRKAMDWIARHLDEPLRLSEAAAVAGLSEGRFRHLFVSETGIAFRPYILWTRLNRALELGFGGVSWTEAAHAANFADQAHLTRTCRRMLGLVPSSLRIDRTASEEKIPA